MKIEQLMARTDLTQKDKLVNLMAEQLGTREPADIANALAISTNSARQSLDKAEEPEVVEQRTLSRAEEVTQALVKVCGYDPNSMSSGDWSHIAKVTKHVVDVGGDGPEVHRRAANLRRKLDLPVTLGSVDKYWSQLASGSPFTPSEVYRS